MTIPCDPPSAPQAAGTMKKKLIPALLGGAVGLFLLLGGSRLIPGISDGSGQATEMPARAPGEAYEVSLDAYRQALESRIASICAQVAGAGDVRVIVSLAGGYEYVYATDEKSAASGTSRLYVTILTEKAPAIRGIGIVCSGGGDPGVRREITSLLSSVFGIGSNCIFVTAKG